MNQQPAPSTTRRRLKRLALNMLGVLMLVIIWYGQSRLFAASRSVAIHQTAATTPTAATPTAASPGPLRVAGYNIAHGRGGALGADNAGWDSREDLEAHLDTIADQLRDADLDIVILNEVDFDAPWSFRLDQAHYLAAKAGFPDYATQRNIDVALPFRVYRFGNAVLSKHSLRNAQLITFEPLSRLEALLAGNHDSLAVDVETPLGAFRVVAVHLEYRSEAVRARAAAHLHTLLDASPLPAIAAGDFNSAPHFAAGHHKTQAGENAIDLLLESGVLHLQEPPTGWDHYLTFPSQAPDRAIDWILLSRELVQTDLQVVPSELSDHLMVQAEIHPPTK